MSDEKKRIYKSEALGLPPLQMVLVQHKKNTVPLAQSQAAEGVDEEEKQPEDAVLRLIEHLQKDK